jgi:hypothetical protein
MMGEDWLERRLAESPAPLRQRLEAPLAGLDARDDIAAALLAAAIGLLEGARGRLASRDAAFDLLAADALLTLACEGAAYSHPDTVAERCHDMGPGGELGRVAERWMGGG